MAARNVLFLATRARIAPTVAAGAVRAASSLSLASGAAPHPAIMMMALNRSAPAVVVGASCCAASQSPRLRCLCLCAHGSHLCDRLLYSEPSVNSALIFETSLDLPMLELPELNPITGLDCPTDSLNGTSVLQHQRSALCIVLQRLTSVRLDTCRAAPGDQAHIPAERAAPQAQARLPLAPSHDLGPQDAHAPLCQGPMAHVALRSFATAPVAAAHAPL